jgi:hypothetical protein
MEDGDGCLDLVRQVIIRIFDFIPEYRLSVPKGVGYRARSDVAVEHARIEHENLNERREPELARLKDGVHVVHILEQRVLRPVHLKLNAPAILVRNEIQIIDAPAPVRELVNRALE